jgi:carbamoyltransferase
VHLYQGDKGVTRAVRWLHRTSGCSDLCLSGGVLMNSVWNGKVACGSEFRRLYVPFAPDDSWNSIGAALWTAHREGERLCAPGEPASPFLGRAYDDAEIRRMLDGFRLRYERPDDVCDTVADLLTRGCVVGWFQGRMEFGQRALGGRSILGDPRDPEMKDRINRAVKYRESFRPFAPAVLAEEASAWFEMPHPVASPYMEKVLKVRPERAGAIPAVVHADGSGRLQTVDAKLSPHFHQLIRAFRARTGVPIVLNTSLNLNDEPIVESPADAIRTYATSGLDALAVGPYLLRK